MFIIKTLLLMILTLPAYANDSVCIDQIPSIESNYNNIKAVPGYVTDQIQIDKEARGLNRFTSKGEVVMVDAERVPWFSKKRKVFYPTEDVTGYKFEGAHLATRTHRKDHRGVEIFDISIKPNLNGESEDEFTLFTLDRGPYYFKNYVLKALPYERDSLEGPLYILSHGKDREVRWSQHTFLMPKLTMLSEVSELKIYFETDFDNTNDGEGYFLLNWLDNSTSGVRIDTCVYFLVSKIEN